MWMHAPSIAAPGTSVVHFDHGVGPDELMEPSPPTGYRRFVTIGAFEDIGWTLAPQEPVFGDGFEDGDTTAWSWVQLGS